MLSKTSSMLRKMASTVKKYRLFHREDKIFADLAAKSPEEACDKAGWPMKEVWVREWIPVVPDPTSESGHRGGGWKDITSRE
jgi:hypothetical protein